MAINGLLCADGLLRNNLGLYAMIK